MQTNHRDWPLVKCPRCSSSSLRRSRLRLIDILRLFIPRYPLRCLKMSSPKLHRRHHPAGCAEVALRCRIARAPARANSWLEIKRLCLYVQRHCSVSCWLWCSLRNSDSTGSASWSMPQDGPHGCGIYSDAKPVTMGPDRSL
jgi:hypothetical protein